MKDNPILAKVLKNLQPGEITGYGFLGNDDRSLIDIITEDEQHMASLELDYNKVGKYLEHLTEEGKKGLGDPCEVDDFLIVTVWEARGKLACPWEDGLYQKVTTTVRNRINNTIIMYSDLSLHMFTEHHFHEGKGSPFRLAPEVLKNLLFKK